jgi:hypothetical protein
MRPRTSFWLTPLLGLLLSAFSQLAHAESPEQKRADELFTEANQLVEAGNYAEACPKYEQSNQLDTGIGTEFKLADCYEHVDRPATALALFRLVEKTAAAAGKTERQQAAGQRAGALEGTVPRLKLTPPPDLRIDDYIIRCDGNILGTAELATQMPLDPGRHELTFAAPGRLSRTVTFNLLPHEGKTFTIPELLVPNAVVTELRPAAHTQRTIAVVTGSAGVAGLLVGTVAGILSIHEHSEYTAAQASCRCASQSAISESQTAYSEGTVSTVGFVVGGVGVAAALTLWFTAPKGSASAPSKSGFELLPAVGPRSASVGLRAAW